MSTICINNIEPISKVYIYLAESGEKVELGPVRSDISSIGPYSFSRDQIASKTKQYIVRYVYFISNNQLVRAREDNMMDTKVRSQVVYLS